MCIELLGGRDLARFEGFANSVSIRSHRYLRKIASLDPWKWSGETNKRFHCLGGDFYNFSWAEIMDFDMPVGA